VPSGRRRLGVKRFTEKLPSPIQMQVSDGFKRGLAELWRTRLEVGGDPKPVLVAHDEVGVEVDQEHAEEAVPTDLFAHEQGATARWKKRAQKAEAQVLELDKRIAWQGLRCDQLDSRVAGLEAELKDARFRLGEQCAGAPAYVWTGPRPTKQRAEQLYRRLMRQRTTERARLVPVLAAIVQQLGDTVSTSGSNDLNGG
jgi:hypothetical protein